MDSTKTNEQTPTKLDVLIEAAQRIREEVGVDQFAVVFAAYVTVTYNVTFVPHLE